ncbi:MAG: hypothetical protein HC904_02150 [Blastochloris sp.]|nr:hypothetical protein [Blastochloris sp.]
MKRAGMAFLYQNIQVGQTGQAGSGVDVRDVPPIQAATYAWQGDDGTKEIQIAREKLDAFLLDKGQKASGYRLLGYNGPDTPARLRTWEFQALLPTTH